MNKRFYFVARLLLLTTVLLACNKKNENSAGDKEQQDVKTALDIAIGDFMSKYQVPGMSVAVTKGEKLVLAKGYGYADVEAKEEVTAKSRFRLASISKSITSVAIMKLVQDGKLKMDDHVFGEGSLLGTSLGANPYNDWIKAITVRQLLTHTAGGWGNSDNDPMFLHPEMTARDLIAWTLDNAPLQAEPGTTYNYSNFGYCILGRIVEELSGLSYEAYVQTILLRSFGESTMVVGGNDLASRKQDEVKYYGFGENPYNFNLARMDSHGGWIASATDLAKFMVHVDGFPQKEDVLNAAQLQVMITPSGLGGDYACGWAVNNWLAPNKGNWWHNGALPGESSFMLRTSTGLNIVILANRRADGDYFGDLEKLVWLIASDPGMTWPDVDLF